MRDFETFTVRLPAHLARRLRFAAAEEELTPEAYIAAGAHEMTLASIESRHFSDSWHEDREAAIAANVRAKSCR